MSRRRTRRWLWELKAQSCRCALKRAALVHMFVAARRAQIVMATLAQVNAIRAERRVLVPLRLAGVAAAVIGMHHAFQREDLCGLV